ncbi:hypothetical protein GCM10027614_15090 [Micromonospora vulcania]
MHLAQVQVGVADEQPGGERRAVLPGRAGAVHRAVAPVHAHLEAGGQPRHAEGHREVRRRAVG